MARSFHKLGSSNVSMVNGAVLIREYLGAMFEHRSHPLVSRRRFAGRLLKHMSLAFALVSVSLALGVWGYMRFAELPFVDAFLNASMILGGMGPVDALTSDGAKYFASFYALYSGITLLGAVAVFLAPIMHRMLHALHLEGAGAERD